MNEFFEWFDQCPVTWFLLEEGHNQFQQRRTYLFIIEEEDEDEEK